MRLSHVAMIASDLGVVAILGHTTGSHLGLPDEQEAELTLIWIADTSDGLVRRWRLVPDSPENRAIFNLTAAR